MDSRSYIDPELAPALEAIQEALPGGFNLHDIQAARAVFRQICLASTKDIVVDGVKMEEQQISGLKEGDPAVSIRIYRPDNTAEEPLPALLWIHGGGFVIGSIKEDDVPCRMMSQSFNCIIVSVEYRLAPEHPFPAPINDCYAALKWLVDNIDALGIAPRRIGLLGPSAGGGLAAGLALMTRDRGEVSLACQVLYYPMLDDRNVEQASDTVSDSPVWTRENNLMGWRSYLGHEPGGKGVSEYAAPSRAKNLSKLPPTYIAVGGLDLFQDENFDYAQRLIAAGVITELHVYPGAYHGFNINAPKSSAAINMATTVSQFIQRHL